MTDTKINNSFELNKAKLDSVRILIPAQEITGNTHYISIPTLRVTEDGEILGDFKTDNTAEVKHKGCRYYIGYLPSLKMGLETIQAYSITLTSKMLGNKYGEGIKNENLYEIYEYIQEQKHTLKFTFETMKKAYWGSAEYAYDFRAKPETYESLINATKENLKAWVQPRGYWNEFNKKTNRGFEINKRGKATPGKPYTHLYNKCEELHSEKNKDLIRMHAIEWHEDMRRLERCFKGKDDFRHLKVTPPTNLEELLTFDPELIERETVEVIGKYYTMKDKKPKHKTIVRETTDWALLIMTQIIRKRPEEAIKEINEYIEILKEAGASPYTINSRRRQLEKALWTAQYGQPKKKPERTAEEAKILTLFGLK